MVFKLSNVFRSWASFMTVTNKKMKSGKRGVLVSGMDLQLEFPLFYKKYFYVKVKPHFLLK